MTRDQAKAATREKFLSGIKAAIEEGRYDALNIRDLAKSVGMSTGAFFSNFESKDQAFEIVTGYRAPTAKAYLALLQMAQNAATVLPAGASTLRGVASNLLNELRP